MLKSSHFLSVLALSLGVVLGLPAQGQDQAKLEASLMLELENALPRKAQTPSAPAAFSHAIDWDQKLQELGDLLARSSGTKVEPHVLFIMANSLFAAERFEEAKAAFEDMRDRFGQHPLAKKVIEEGGRTQLDQALDACTRELTFRAGSKPKSLPRGALDPTVTVTLHLSPGDVKIRFFKDAAPEHRANFIKLARQGFYDRTRAFRINPGRHVHFGCPNTRDNDYAIWGRGEPGFSLPAEHSLATHRTGAVSMLRTTGKDRSHGCQFQILLADQPHLDFGQTVFAEVVSGIDVLQEISRRSRNQYESPIDHVWLNGITVEETKAP